MGGSKQARAESFMRHLEPLQGALESYCRRCLHRPGEVADVLQSALVKAFRDFHLYTEGTNFRAWMFRIVNLEILNWNRKHERHRHEPLPEDISAEETWQLILDEPLLRQLLDDPEVVLDHCEAPLAEAVRGLPSPERSVFLLRVIGDFKYREIGEILELPIGSVMGYLARARSRLRQRLVTYGEERGLLHRETSGGLP